MPYPIQADARERLQAYQHQLINIDIYPTDVAGPITIDESRINQGGFTLNRKCESGKAIGFGSCIASEVTLSLHNEDGFFDDIKLEGAELYVKLRVHVDDELYRNIPLGYFTVDGCPKKRSKIQLNALDRMVELDQVIPADLFDAFPMTASNTISWIASHSGLGSYTTSGLVNTDYMIRKIYEMNEGEITYRQLLSWVCQIVGANAFINPSGVLTVKWYDRDSAVTGLSPLTPSMRSSLEYEDFDITFTGLRYVDTEGEEYSISYVSSGQITYELVFNDNPLITYNPQSVVNGLGPIIAGFTYRPCKATFVPSPQLYPMDMFKLQIGNDSDITTIVTSMTFKINSDTKTEAVGESVTAAGYAELNPMTGRESAIVAKLKLDSESSLSSEVRRTLAFSELISNALGLYYTADEQTDGSTIYYLHNGVTRDVSSVIFTINANGVAWTTDWNNGSPIWTQGVSSSGDAFFRHISARGLDLSNIDDPYHVEITPGTFTIYYGVGETERVVATIRADEADGARATTMQIPRVIVSGYEDVGAIRLVGKTNGLDFVYIGD